MSINKAYMVTLNRKGSRIKKIFLQIKEKIFSSRPDVIQIGVGGYSSSGKTVLIDAMFSLFDLHAVPEYMPKKTAGKFLNAAKLLPPYKPHSTLRAIVSNYFHQNHATKDDGKWNENTHCAKLDFSKNEKILLIRNIPGEMFELYCKQDGTENISLKSKFETFISSKNEYKKIIRKIYSYKITKDELKESLKLNLLKDNLKNVAAVFEDQLKILIEELNFNNIQSASNRDEYNSIIDNNINDEFIKQSKKEILILLLMYQIRSEFMLFIKRERSDVVEKNFFAFLFYYTANFNVYCVKSADLSEQEIKVANDNISNASSGEGNFIICLTQFDRILLEKRLPEITSEHAPSVKNSTPKLNEKLRELFGSNKHTDPTNNVINDELTKYWLAMNKLYEDINSAQPKFIDQKKWNTIKTITQIKNNNSYDWFCTSVAYNFRENKFFGFSNQTSAPKSTHDVWTLLNNNDRTPIGVLELLLYILLKNGCKVNNWKLPFHKPMDRFITIRQKMRIS